MRIEPVARDGRRGSQPTYKGLKHPTYFNGDGLGVGLEPTYKGLKHEVIIILVEGREGLEPTYEGLKHVICH